jgi:hypothetical protein
MFTAVTTPHASVKQEVCVQCTVGIYIGWEMFQRITLALKKVSKWVCMSSPGNKYVNIKLM